MNIRKKITKRTDPIPHHHCRLILTIEKLILDTLNRLDGRIEALKREISNENLSRTSSKSKSPLRDNYYRNVLH